MALRRQTTPAVISAFPATGKTFVAGRDHRFADSDSSEFSWAAPGERHPDWPDNYMAHIAALRGSPGTLGVFVSTHAEVRAALAERAIPFTLAYPESSLREEYRQRMIDRGSPDALIAKVIDELWDDALADCAAQTGCSHVVLGPGQYLANVRRALEGKQ